MAMGGDGATVRLGAPPAGVRSKQARGEFGLGKRFSFFLLKFIFLFSISFKY